MFKQTIINLTSCNIIKMPASRIGKLSADRPNASHQCNSGLTLSTPGLVLLLELEWKKFFLRNLLRELKYEKNPILGLENLPQNEFFWNACKLVISSIDKSTLHK